MMKTYVLAIETEHNLKALPFGPLTLAKAEEWRDKLADMGKAVFVVNFKSE